MKIDDRNSGSRNGYVDGSRVSDCFLCTAFYGCLGVTLSGEALIDEIEIFRSSGFEELSFRNLDSESNFL